MSFTEVFEENKMLKKELSEQTERANEANEMAQKGWRELEELANCIQSAVLDV